MEDVEIDLDQPAEDDQVERRRLAPDVQPRDRQLGLGGDGGADMASPARLPGCDDGTDLPIRSGLRHDLRLHPGLPVGGEGEP